MLNKHLSSADERIAARLVTPRIPETRVLKKRIAESEMS